MTEQKSKSPEPATAGDVKAAEEVTLEQLLCDISLNSPQIIPSLFSQPQFGNLDLPDEIRVHCDHEKCGGERRHVKQANSGRLEIGNYHYSFVTYVCTNCKSRFKVFGLKSEYEGKTIDRGRCTKIYQEPPFGQPIPRRLFKVIGEDNREHFLQARRAIARGLGIGAYAYYRRIVENTKFALVDSILNVAKKTKAASAQIDLLEKAQSENQFSTAVGMLSDVGAIPPVLLIDGHNPLILLHDLLSQGIHQLDDAECLKRAQEAEIILCEIADRMQVALSERKALTDALTSIRNRGAKKDVETQKE